MSENIRDTISASLVLYNEEPVIRRCLESIKDVVDEIIVAHDGPCLDRTLEICAEYTDKIFIRPRIGEAEPHRVFTFEQATSEWILYIDADEYLGEELRTNLKRLAAATDVDLYNVLWPYTDGKTDLTLHLKHPYRPILARRSKLWFVGIPRQPISTLGNTAHMDMIMYHRPQYNNFTFHSFRHKWIPWNRAEVDYLLRDPKSISTFGLPDPATKVAEIQAQYRAFPLLKTPYTFLRSFGYYLYKGLWKIGWPGLRIAFFASLSLASVRFIIFQRLRRDRNLNRLAGESKALKRRG